MIHRRELILVMGCANISNKTLFIMLSKYVIVCLFDIDEIIRAGVKGWLRPYVAFVLRIKEHTPPGFNPPPLLTMKKTQQLSFALIGGNRQSYQKGVHYDRRQGDWLAKITVKKVRHFIGRYPTEQKAIAAYRAYVKNLRTYRTKK